MKQTYRITPVYTGDVSGVCSALYELGGMVVMHDPSGCNSTYNTFDENRWYDRESLIFLSGLKESDALLGNDAKLVDDVVKAAEEFHPAFIAITASPIPYLVGTDFTAIATLVTARTGIPAFHVPTNGMHDYVFGAGRALEQIAERFVGTAGEDMSSTGAADAAPADAPADDPVAAADADPVVAADVDVRRGHLNILGVTPLDFAAAGSAASLRGWVESIGWNVTSCWAMGSTLEELGHAPEASVNLVVSALGLAAAKVLRQRFGTPYVVGCPVPGFSDELAVALEHAQDTGSCAVPCTWRGKAADGSRHAVVVGEPVTMGSVAVALQRRGGMRARLVCPLEADAALLDEDDALVVGEEQVESALAGADLIVADPLYQLIAPRRSRFVPLAHLAFSGRVYRHAMPDLAHLWEGVKPWED